MLLASGGRARLADASTLAPEEYARLHAEIEQASRPAACFVVGVTSAVYGEGKTTVAMNLALTMAQNSDQRVALVDLNLRNRDLQSRLDLAPCAGVVEVVEDNIDVSEVVHRTDIDNFTILPAGRKSMNPARIARSPRLAELATAMRAANDFIVIDLAAVLPVTDTRLLARLVDGIVMVVRAGVTPREVVARAIDTIGEDRVLGVVLNGTQPALPSWLNRLMGGTLEEA